MLRKYLLNKTEILKEKAAIKSILQVKTVATLTPPPFPYVNLRGGK